MLVLQGSRRKGRMFGFLKKSHRDFDDPEMVAFFNVPPEMVVGSASRRGDKFMARVQLNKRQKFVGYFNTKEECYAANERYLKAHDPNLAVKDPEAWNRLAHSAVQRITKKYEDGK